MGDENHESGTEKLSITVEHDDTLPPDYITAKENNTKCCVDTKVSASVIAGYADGYEREVKGTITNLKDIDMSVLGKKILEISYSENGKTVTTNVGIEVVNHTSGTELKENIKAASESEKGSYDKVIYCKVCGKEISRKKITIPQITNLPAVGKSIKDEKSGGIYIITKSSISGGTVVFKQPISKKVKAINIPATVTKFGVKFKVTGIQKNAFKKNKYITKVAIGNNVKTIGANAFYGCKRLKTLKLGKKVASIGKKAFYGCKKLKDITITSKKLKKGKVGKSAFKGISKKATIKAPKSKLKLYKILIKKT